MEYIKNVDDKQQVKNLEMFNNHFNTSFQPTQEYLDLANIFAYQIDLNRRYDEINCLNSPDDDKVRAMIEEVELYENSLEFESLSVFMNNIE